MRRSKFDEEIGDHANPASSSGIGHSLSFALVLLAILSEAASAADGAAGIAFFESKIRPVLVERCQECHSGSLAKPKGHLRLDTREGIRKGGTSGPAVVPGDIEASILFQAITAADGYEPMPPKGKLPAAVIADFRRWIEMGAPDPRDGTGKPVTAARPGRRAATGGRSGRSGDRPSRRSSPRWPAGRAQPIDRFILAKLAEKGLRPSREADRRTLIRRLSFDLIGLPPTPEEVAAFLDDPVARRLRAARRSPAGQPSLRRALGAALDGRRPFRRDPRPRPGPHPAQCLALSRLPDRGLQPRHALCPIRPGAGRRRRPLPRRARARRRAGHDRRRPLGRELAPRHPRRQHRPPDRPLHRPRRHGQHRDVDVRQRHGPLRPLPRPQVRPDHPGRLLQPPGRLRRGRQGGAGLRRRPGRRPAAAHRWPRTSSSRRDAIPRWRPGWRAELSALPPQQLVFAAASEFAPDASHKPPGGPRPVHVLRRGDIHQPGTAAAPGTLGCVAGLPSRFAMPQPGSDESARRAALARWLTDPRNPLTWRSIVNRVWHYHFDRGIVATPNDFGRMGATPVPSRAARLAGRDLPRFGRLAQAAPPADRHQPRSTGRSRGTTRRPRPSTPTTAWLWRQHRRRLDAESIHDAILRVAGRLETTMGGPSVQQFTLSPGVHVTPVVDYTRYDWNSPGAVAAERLPLPVPHAPRPVLRRPRRRRRLAAHRGPQRVDHAAPGPGAAEQPVRPPPVRALRPTAGALAPDLDRPHRGRLRAGLWPRADVRRDRRCWRATPARHGLANLCRLIVNSNEFLFVN